MNLVNIVTPFKLHRYCEIIVFKLHQQSFTFSFLKQRKYNSQNYIIINTIDNLKLERLRQTKTHEK